jgi:hypothetical protein
MPTTPERVWRALHGESVPDSTNESGPAAAGTGSVG